MDISCNLIYVSINVVKPNIMKMINVKIVLKIASCALPKYVYYVNHLITCMLANARLLLCNVNLLNIYHFRMGNSHANLVRSHVLNVLKLMNITIQYAINVKIPMSLTHIHPHANEKYHYVMYLNI